MTLPADLLHRWHERLLGTGVGERTRSLVRGLIWTAPAGLLSRVVTGVATVLTARAVGPEQWGHVGLALAAGTWLQVPQSLGLPTALLHGIPSAAPDARRARASAGLLVLALAGCVTAAVVALVPDVAARVLGVDRQELLAGLLWSSGFLVHWAAMASLSGLERFRARAAGELGFAIAFGSGVLALGLAGALDWRTYLLAMGLAYALAGLVLFAAAGLPLPRPVPRWREHARALVPYGLLACGGIAAGALMHATARQVMAAHGRLEDVGILSAYQGGSTLMAAYLHGLLIMVLLPVASRTPDRAALLRKMRRVLLPFGLGSVAVFAAILWAWMLVLGRQYPIEPAAFAAFAVAGALLLVLSGVQSVLAAGGTRGIAVSTLTFLVAGGVQALAAWRLIPAWGLAGAGLAAALGALAGVACGLLPRVQEWGGSLRS